MGQHICSDGLARGNSGESANKWHSEAGAGLAKGIASELFTVAESPRGQARVRDQTAAARQGSPALQLYEMLYQTLRIREMGAGCSGHVLRILSQNSLNVSYIESFQECSMAKSIWG